MVDICLVACASKKLPFAAQARNLYDSALFKKSRAWAENGFDRWFVLSAKHGLVEPDTALEPYDLTLNELGVAERRAWAFRVWEVLLRFVGSGDAFTFLAGKRYRESLAPWLQAEGVRILVPLEGLRIGEQLQRLDQMASRDR